MKNVNYGEVGRRGTSIRLNTINRKMQIKSLNVAKSPFMGQIDQAMSCFKNSMLKLGLDQPVGSPFLDFGIQ